MGKKKEKITYIDDGRTLADMSALSGRRIARRPAGVPGPRVRDVWHTYWDAVRMMLLPMLVVVLALVILYLLLTVIFTLA